MRACPLFCLLVTVVACFLTVCAQGASAQDAGAGADAEIDLSLNVGFDSYVAPGWVGVAVAIRNSGADVAGRLVARALGPELEVTFQASRDVRLSGEAQRTYWLYIHANDRLRSVEVELIDEAGESVAQTSTEPIFMLERWSARRLRSRVGLRILTVGAESERLSAETRRRNDKHTWLPPLHGSQLPDRAIAYSLLDVVICQGLDLSASLQPRQARALVDWVRAGGVIVLAPPLEPGWFAGPVQQALLPGLESVGLVEVEEFDQLSSLHSRVPEGKVAVLDAPWPGSRVVLSETVRQRSIPLLQKGALGEGSVWLLSCDVLRPPLSEWRGTRSLFSEHVFEDILRWRMDGNVLAWQPRESGHRDDMVNPTLMGAFEEGLGSLLPLVLLLMAIYLLLVGPVNRFVLRRHQAEVWSVVTIPTLAVVGTAVILGVLYLSKGRGRVVRRVTVLEVRLGERHAWESTVVAVTEPGRFSMGVDMHPHLVGLPIYWDSNQAQHSRTDVTQRESFSLENHQVSSWQTGVVLGRGIRDLEGVVDVINVGDELVLLNGTGAAVEGGVFDDGTRRWLVPAGGRVNRLTLNPLSMQPEQVGARRLGGLVGLDALVRAAGSGVDLTRERHLVSEVLRGLRVVGPSRLGTQIKSRLWLRLSGTETRMSVRGEARLESDVQLLYGRR